ncbi:hypothetical protein [Paenibacillus hubeiensis]|uniref:hypothetical protein n=1 Tax=Paenibacillus hubeiensis TaxID=3077330 RepID=UPI0031BB4524
MFSWFKKWWNGGEKQTVAAPPTFVTYEDAEKILSELHQRIGKPPSYADRDKEVLFTQRIRLLDKLLIMDEHDYHSGDVNPQYYIEPLLDALLESVHASPKSSDNTSPDGSSENPVSNGEIDAGVIYTLSDGTEVLGKELTRALKFVRMWESE